MAVSSSVVGAVHSTALANSYTTTAFTPTAGNRLTAFLVPRKDTIPCISSVAGGGLTWTSDIGLITNSTSGADLNMYAYRAVASGCCLACMTVTASWGCGACLAGGHIVVFESSGVDTTTACGTADTASDNADDDAAAGVLDGTAGNGVIAAIAVNSNCETFTWGSPLTADACGSGQFTGPTSQVGVAASACPDTGPDVSWVGSVEHLFMAIELTAAACGGCEIAGPITYYYHETNMNG